MESTLDSPDKIEWRFIDGTKGCDDRYHREHRKWADVIAIWSRTPLDHKVSSHYDGKSDGRVIKVAGTGIASLCYVVMAHVEQR